MRKRKRKAEQLPWYRARNYKGNLTEDHKRRLDSFRMQPKHPATRYAELPEEVKGYIVRIEMEAYDGKQQAAAGRAFFGTAVGAVLLYLNYKGALGTTTIWIYAAAVLLIVASWILYRREWHKNAEEFLPSDEPTGPTDEGIRQEWEIDYIGRVRQAERDAAREA